VASMSASSLPFSSMHDSCAVRPASPADHVRARDGPKEGDGITMAKDANCPNCDGVSLIHTGAFWICPRCGLMITKHALAAEIMRTGRADRPDEEATNVDRVTGPATD